MIMIKADMMISELYSRLEDDPAIRDEIFGEIKIAVPGSLWKGFLMLRDKNIFWRKTFS